MDKVIEVDFKVTWLAPVFVRIGNGYRERVDGPEAALEALAHRWPESQSEIYGEAKLRCLKALVQHGSAETARSRFIDAAIAAGVFA
ncbi:DUF982 domain-containing protein [Rhizobium sp. WYCCWR 11279]|uniref:DUF982 domain-containing protein n=1 Tax=Rhizobium changzhiense TaxID=2692317 RepID=A0A7Z0ZW09_9HYPH|nr:MULTISPECIES: DUF982 domain-containing protein [Rhizobium]MCH4547225.1 DUF982 domain-containing protein [Rhizobium changzhiense]MCV9945043.1 DUF982 domain-containing protein [Rhizobium sp. BT-175]MCW0019197.1 DUF982 domain-containing protein [Rhizobium sp. BT-226]NNU49091.1 DUF982 domain-containing protein [Rhizobium changzhiense]NZD65872.1 DUF982 domain-containing protein [Rhizobium changzhiense]